ncbi:MAG: HAMP domain-containing sensor histidine kinase, partial [Bacteroidota bacterium]
TNLEPGDYNFKVRGTNSDKLLNEEGVAFNIKVIPPFWRTKGFLFMMLVLAILAVTSIYSFLVKLKTNKILEEKNHELEDANSRLIESQQNLKVLNDTKDKFFSIIAHDLRNPFNPLLSLTELLHDDYDSFDEKERRDFIKDIRNGAKRLYDLLENLLQWSLSQTKQIKFSRIRLEMNELISKNIDLLRINSDKKNINIINDVKNGTYILADENMINSIIRNLLNNAIKFSSDGTKITISSIDTGLKYQFAVKDEGFGIKPEYIDTLFDFGFSKTRIGKSNERGSGLGLILCKEFVEKNNGEIKVESEMGKGSAFYFTAQKAD